MTEATAKELRAAMSLGEGPAVDTALYKLSTKPPSAETTLTVKGWTEVVTPFHQNGVDDQFIPPIVRIDDEGNAVGIVKEGDVMFYTDFRTDRAKPLTAAFLDIPYGGQDGGLTDVAKEKNPEDLTFVTMTHYDGNFLASKKLKEAFNPAKPLQDTYAEVIGRAGISQLIAAESEKWRAVTWFKDGRRNLGYKPDSEDGILRTEKHPELPITVKIVQSRQVAAHIQAPQMRAKEITEVLMQGVKDGVADIFANYANSDMVAHAMTQPDWFEGVVEAILELDVHLGTLVPAAVKAGYVVFITGDHGNAEQMMNGEKANPAHTCNKVPMIVLGLGDDEKLTIKESATIGDLGPSCMQLRGLEMPECWDRTTFFEGEVKPSKDRKIMRLVLDGYGINADETGNAMASAAKKKGSPLHMDNWMGGAEGAVFGPAEASGLECGYPEGQSGTTEFGHVLFDAGRTVRSDLTLIDYAIESGEFKTNEALLAAIKIAKEKNSTLHVMGILSDGKVHASLTHLEGLLDLFKAEGVDPAKVSLHPITDGRDVAGDSSPKYLEWLEKTIKEKELGGQINSIWGRGWGKDRDNRWGRIEASFRSLVEGTAALHLKFA